MRASRTKKGNVKLILNEDEAHDVYGALGPLVGNEVTYSLFSALDDVLFPVDVEPDPPIVNPWDAFQATEDAVKKFYAEPCGLYRRPRWGDFNVVFGD